MKAITVSTVIRKAEDETALELPVRPWILSCKRVGPVMGLSYLGVTEPRTLIGNPARHVHTEALKLPSDIQTQLML